MANVYHKNLTGSALHDNKPHEHPQSEVTNLVTDLASKATLANIFSGLAKITVGTTEPTNPSVGDLWIDTN